MFYINKNMLDSSMKEKDHVEKKTLGDIIKMMDYEVGPNTHLLPPKKQKQWINNYKWTKLTSRKLWITTKKHQEPFGAQKPRMAP